MISVWPVVIGAELQMEEVRVGGGAVDRVELARFRGVRKWRRGPFPARNGADSPVKICLDVERRLRATLE